VIVGLTFQGCEGQKSRVRLAPKLRA